jgi:hypothetical protein
MRIISPAGLGIILAVLVYITRTQVNIGTLIMMIGGTLQEVLLVMVSGLGMNTTVLYVEVYGLIIAIKLVFRILAEP